jgi:hypothetical protein
MIAALREPASGPASFAVHERRPIYRTLPGLSPGLSQAVQRREPLPVSRSSRVRLHLKPGQKGTKQLMAEYGDRLICVRYRYDPERKKRLKTVELVVSERDWAPPPPRFRPHTIVSLHVPYADMTTRSRVKQAGATWNPARKAWQLRYDQVLLLGLTSHITNRPASTSR